MIRTLSWPLPQKLQWVLFLAIKARGYAKRPSGNVPEPEGRTQVPVIVSDVSRLRSTRGIGVETV